LSAMRCSLARLDLSRIIFLTISSGEDARHRSHVGGLSARNFFEKKACLTF